MKKLIEELENFEFQKGLSLSPEKLKLLQQLSIFMIINDDYQKIDLFDLNLNLLEEEQFRNKIETFKASESFQKIQLYINEFQLDIKFSIASLLFLMTFIDNDKDLMIYLLYIKIISNKKKIKDINYQIIIKEFFPISTFKKENIDKFWELQYDKEDLIFKKESWDSLNIK